MSGPSAACAGSTVPAQDSGLIHFLRPSDLTVIATPMTAPHRAPFSESISKTIATPPRIPP